MSGRASVGMSLVLLLFSLAVVRTGFGQRIIFVDADAAGANNGTSWADAYNCLQDALTDAKSSAKPVETRVAAGLYKPDQSNGVASGNRTATFQLINGVTLKGRYAGFGAPDPNARDIGVYETVLSGDLAGNDIDVYDPCDLLDEPTRADNSYHVITAEETNETAILDGFTITGGNANGYHRHTRGGGMYNYDTSPTLIDCTFKWNCAKYDGGGMYGGHTMAPANCRFINNVAETGAGMNGGAYTVLTNCTFKKNSASFDGGGICTGDGVVLINCTFSGNSAYKSGGAMCSYGDTQPMLANCTFAENSATYGNAVSFDSYHQRGSGSVVELSNCILWDGGNEIWNHNDSMITVTYSDVQGGWPGEGNIDADPCFADPGYWDPNGTPQDANDDSWVDGDYYLKSQAGRWDASEGRWTRDDVTSPCIDAGDLMTPLGDEPFPNGGVINMGAYGGTSKASKSYFGEPVCETIFAGDINGDCKVDFRDFRLMGLHWLEDNSGLSEVPELYYYSGGKRIYLEIYAEYFTVCFEEGVTDEEKEGLVEADPLLERIVSDQLSFGLTWIETKLGSSDADIIQGVTRLEKLSEVRYATPVFGLTHSWLLLTDEFIAKFKPGVEEDEIEALNALHNVEIARKIAGIEHYVLRAKDPTNMNALKTANLYYEDPITEFAVPNFVAVGTELP